MLSTFFVYSFTTVLSRPMSVKYLVEYLPLVVLNEIAVPSVVDTDDEFSFVFVSVESVGDGELVLDLVEVEIASCEKVGKNDRNKVLEFMSISFVVEDVVLIDKLGDELSE